MPRTSYPAPSRTETPAGLRDMAVRARRLAWGMPDALTVARLNAFAAELEARAAALEPAAQIFSHAAVAPVRQAEDDVGES